MSYVPFFRGKQFELVLIREQSRNLAGWNISPIIEPIKENFSAVVRAAESLDAAGCRAWIVVNPKVGGIKGKNLFDLAEARSLCEVVDASEHINWLYHLSAESDLAAVREFLAEKSSSAIFHHGDVAAPRVASALLDGTQTIAPAAHFFTPQCGERYRSKFSDAPGVMIADGFEKKLRNSDYVSDEFFSDALLTYRAAGFAGFGDYLMVGHEYLDGGGPALTVAIHLTYKNPADDGALHIRHFKSVSNETAENPAEKFAEALSDLVAAVAMEGSPIQRTSAVEEFLELDRKGHFPGLGYVKKLSMQHHLELLAGS